MKYKISKAAHEKLSEDMKLEYKADGDHFILLIEGQPSEEGSAALRNALDRERSDNAELRTQITDLGKKLSTAEAKAGEGDQEAKREVVRLTKKIETMTTDHDAKIKAKDTAIADAHRDSVVSGLAAKISTSPAVISPHIASRLDVSIDPETNLPKVGIKGKDGKIDAALTIDKLGEEFVANPDFKGIIKGSGAGGTRPSVPVSGAPSTQGNGNIQQNQPTNLATVDSRTLIETIRGRVAERRQAGGQT